MKLIPINKKLITSISISGIIAICLLMFFIAKPFIKKSLYNTTNSIELCEENEGNSEENESQQENDLFETDLPSQYYLNNIFFFTSDINDSYTFNYINSYNPKVSAPPPELV